MFNEIYYFNIRGNGGNYIPINFSSNWNTVNNYGEGIGIEADCNIIINGIPSEVDFKLKGKGSVILTPTGKTINVGGTTEINVVKLIKILDSKNITFSNLLFSNSSSISVVDKNNSPSPIVTLIAELLEKTKTSTNHQFSIGSLLKLGVGAELNTGILTIGANISKKSLLSETQTSNTTIELHYNFTDNGIPLINLTKYEGLPPNKIKLIYEPTHNYPQHVDFNEWIDYPLTIITGEFNCEEWREKIVFESSYSDLNDPNSKMTSICDSYTDIRDNTQSLQIKLKSIPDMSKIIDNSNNIKPIIKNNTNYLIISGIILIIAAIGFLIFNHFYLKNDEIDLEHTTKAALV